MKRIGVCAVAALSLGATFAAAHGGGGGGGHAGGRTFTYTFSYGTGGANVFGNSGPAGMAVQMPIELTAAAPTVVEGDIRRDDVIAQHTVRVVEARVLLQAVDSGHPVPAGTVLAKLTGVNGAPVVWCDIRGRYDDGWRAPHNLHVCLSESTPGSGRFDQAWVGESASDFLGIERSAIRDAKPLSAPAPYRAARQEELPTGLLGYRWCEGDGVSGPPRFAVAVTLPGQAWATGGPLGCAFGIWPNDGDHAHVDIDGVTLTVQPGQNAQTLHYSFAGRIPAAAVLSPLEPGAPVRGVGQSPTPKERQAAREANAHLQMLIPDPDGAAPKAVGGPIDQQTAFFSAGVRHGITGVLRNKISGSGYLSRWPLPVGQKVFGMLATGPAGVQIVWCAPILQAHPYPRNAPKWQSVCLPNNGWTHEWLQNIPGVFPQNLMLGSGTDASTPTVDRREVTILPMTLSLRYGGFDPKSREVTVLMMLDWGEGPIAVRRLTSPLEADGAAAFHLMDAEFAVTPQNGDPGSAERANIEVRRQPESGAKIF